jgi:hypothetical protein
VVGSLENARKSSSLEVFCVFGIFMYAKLLTAMSNPRRSGCAGGSSLRIKKGFLLCGRRPGEGNQAFVLYLKGFLRYF